MQCCRNIYLRYKQEICNLVEYNHPAAAGDYDGSREAWQLVYIFDGDPEDIWTYEYLYEKQ